MASVESLLNPSPAFENKGTRASSSWTSICLSNGRSIIWSPIQTHYEFSRKFAFGIIFIALRIRAGPNDLFPNTTLEPLDDASNSLSTQSDGRQRGNFFRAHSLPEVEPENHTVALLVETGQAMLQVFINLVQKDSESDSLLTTINFLPRFWVNIAGGDMRIGATRRLSMAVLEIVVCDVGGSFL